MTQYDYKGRLFEITPALIIINPNPPLKSCTSEIENIQFESVITSLVVTDRDSVISQTTPICSAALKPFNFQKKDQDLEKSQRRLAAIGSPTEYDYDSTKYFKKDWLTSIDNEFPNRMPTTLIRGNEYIQKWFMYNPQTKRYHCRTCVKYIDLFPISNDNRRGTAQLWNKNGVEISDYGTNWRLISKHDSEDSIHANIIDKLKALNLDKMDQTFIDAQTKKDIENKQVEATAKVFRTVFVGVMGDFPFRQHRPLIELQRTHGVMMGSHLDSDKDAVAIMTSIGNFMHEKLITQLKTKSEFLSMIVDCTTDRRKHSYLSVLFLSLEDGRPVVYFYRLIELSKDETGKGMFDALKFYLAKDKLTETIKTKISGFTSDGIIIKQ